MSISWLSLAAPLFLVFLVKVTMKYICSGGKKYPYPPGPKPLPIIGNLLDLQAVKDPGPDYMEWGDKYKSDILFASALGSHVLILNKQADADELFERRSKLYSDRPHMPMTSLVGWDVMVSVMPYGDYWRKCRKVCQQHFNYSATKKYHPLMQEKVQRFLAGLLDSPSKLPSHNKMLSVSFAMAIMYGYEVKCIDDPMIAVADKSFALAGSLLRPGESVINTLPFLRHIPPWLAGPLKSRKTAEEAMSLTKYMQESMWCFSENSVKNGPAAPSLVTDFLKNKASGASAQEAKIINDVAFTFYGGAAETTIAITTIFFYLMAKHPKVQKRAQAEMDALTSSTRLPRFEDRPLLPYIEAVYREVMRWQQSLPLAVPHALTEDDYYKGYFIPKGTTVIGNVWAMSRDEDVFPDPHSFKPERFFDEHGDLNSNNRILAYGFGRRICVGKSIASSLTWLMMISSLACFNIGKAKDEFGNEIELDEGFHTLGLMRQKNDYKVSIVPRARIYRDLIHEDASGRTRRV